MANALYARASDCLNAVVAAVDVNGGTEDTGYLAECLLDLTTETLPKPAKLTTTSGGWALNFSTTQVVAAVLLWLHNFDEGLDVRWQGKQSAPVGYDWSTPDLEVSFTIPADRADGQCVGVLLDLRTTEAYTEGRTDYRLYVAEANSAACAAKIFLYDAITDVTRWNFELHHEPAWHARSEVLVTDLGYTAGVIDHAITQLTWRGSIVADAEADAEALRDWFLDAHGAVSPVLWAPDPDAGEGLLVRFDPHWVPEIMTNAATRAHLLLTEVPRGAPL